MLASMHVCVNNEPTISKQRNVKYLVPNINPTMHSCKDGRHKTLKSESRLKRLDYYNSYEICAMKSLN